MLDFVLGAALAALAVRGWIRGFVKELLDLVALILGVWVAFRLSGPLGDFFTHSFGVTPEVARIGSGVLLFVLFGVALSIAAHFLTRVMKLPGLNTINRVGGAAVALAWGVVLVLVAVNLIRVVPVPDSVAQAVDDSVVVETIAGPEAWPQRWFHRIAGDSVLLALQNLQALFGQSRVVPQGDQVVSMPMAPADEVRQVRSEAVMITEELNRIRAGAGLAPFALSPGLQELAEFRAVLMYTSGEVGRMVDCRPETAAIPGLSVVVCTDLVALAGNALGALDGIVASVDGETVLARRDLDRGGVAVVDGPLGRLVVVVLGG